MVLSADWKAIMLNEGHLYAGLEKWDIDQRVADFRQQFKPGKVQPSTNRGVRMGMSESQVRRILGKPEKAIWSAKFQARELIYARKEKWKVKRGEEGMGTGMSWHNYYLFRGGKLFYIELSQNLEGGA